MTQTLIAITLDHNSPTFASLIDRYDHRGIKVTILADMAHYFALKDKEKLEFLWKTAAEKGHDVQLLLRDPPTKSFIQESKETLESLLKPLRTDYELIAFRALTPLPKTSYELLIQEGLYCDTSVCVGGTDYPFPYSQHQPYFASIYAPQLKAPPSEKMLLEIPLIKNLNSSIKQAHKKNKERKTPPIFKKILGKLTGAYCRFYKIRSTLNRVIPSQWMYWMCEQKPESLVKKTYFVTDEIIHFLAPHYTSVTLSEMAHLARNELHDAIRKDSLEEAEFQVEENYFAIMGEDRNATQSYYLQEMIPWDRTSLLDFGCGTGYWTKRIADLYPWIQKAVGIDYGEDFIQKANDRYKDLRVSFIRENFEAISLPDGSFDCVYADATLEHAFDITLALKEIYRLLCEGGALIALIPSDARNPQRINPGHTWKTFPQETLARLQEAGFVNIEIEEVDVYKTFAMAPYPPSDNRMMYIRAWKLPSPQSLLFRVVYAMRWLNQIDLSLVDSQEDRPGVLKKLLEKEGHTLTQNGELLHITLNEKNYFLDPLKNRYALEETPKKWMSIHNG